MSILGWIGFGIGLLVMSFLAYMVGWAIARDDSSKEMSNPESCLMLVVPIISLIAGVYAKITVPANIGLILTYVGGGSIVIGVIMALLNRLPGVEKLKAKGNVKGLVRALDYKDKAVRKDAAEALIALYKLGKLDDEHKKLILSKRDAIIQKHNDWGGGHSDRHSDQTHHTDRDCYNFGYHYDSPPENKHNDTKEAHTDTGIGVDFPL